MILENKILAHFPHRWNKQGLLFDALPRKGWNYSHAHKPTVFRIARDTARVFFGARDTSNRTFIAAVDVQLEREIQVLEGSLQIVLPPGPLGAFDDAGVNPACVVPAENGDIYMYTFGWNPGTTVPTRNAIGLVISRDGGQTFNREWDGPILDRDRHEAYFTTAPYVIREGSGWKMWYTSGRGWELVNGQPEIKYHICTASSPDGIQWTKDGNSAIPPAHPLESNARPCVLRDSEGYHMWFCYRDIRDYRSNPKNGYHLGYAHSSDGLKWDRAAEAALEPSPSGWDSRMVAYPALIQQGNALIMFYNGNGFGKAGFGCAVQNLTELPIDA